MLTMFCNKCGHQLRTFSSLSNNLPLSEYNLRTLSCALLPWIQSPRRHYATAWKRRMIKQEQIKEVVNQYASKNTKPTDRVYTWGYAGTGALGVRTFLKPLKNQPPRSKQLTPQRLDFFDGHKMKVTRVGCGYGFSVFICDTQKDTKVFGCGINTDSQLGFQESPRNSGRILDYVIEPATIELPLVAPESTKVLGVACGRAHSLIMTDNEGVFSLGNNAYGQCGRAVIENESYRGSQIINKIAIDRHIIQVVCGQDNSLFLTDTGQVFSCGLGADGQTGLGHYDITAELTMVSGDISGEKIVSLGTTADCVLAVSAGGDVFGWGNSEYGQLSSVAPDDMQLHTARHLPFKGVGRVLKATAAGSMCAILNDEGQVFVWGYGILGKGPKLERSEQPQLIPETLFGRNEFNPDQKVVDIQCGISHFAAITNSGDLYMWGRNKMACLGLGNVLDQFFPFKVQVPAAVREVICGVDHTLALCRSFA